MRSELVEFLRCPAAHDEAGLVALAHETVDRDIRRGALGCPVCGAEYPIVDGVADFRAGQAGAALPTAKDRPDEALALRAGGLLALADARGLVVLAGEWTRAAPELAAMAEGIRILALDAAPGVTGDDLVSLALTAGPVPVKSGAARGIALDAAHAADGHLATAATALAPRGRLIAPVDRPLPAGLIELARDAREWVAERTAASAPVPLARAKARAVQPPASDA